LQITQAQFETRVPLLNATSDTVLDFGSGLSLRAATAEETARWFQDEHVRDVVPHRVFPHILWVLVAEHRGRSTEELEYYLMAWFGTASLLAGREVEAAFSEEWAPRSDGSLRMLHNSIKLFPLSLPVSSAPPWQGPIPLQRLCDGIVASIPRFRSETKNARIFHFALSRWIYAQNSDRRTAEDAVLDLSIALEAIFIGHGERIPVAKAMRERIAVFWSGTRSGSAARKMRDDVCDAYDVRSMVAHGQVVEGDRLDSARKLFDGIVRETLLDFAGGGLDDFDPMTLWVPA
jgi:hypothetical protein